MGRVLLDVSGVLTPEDSKTNKPFPFTVDGCYERLRIEYRYEPKNLSDDAEALRMLAEGMEHCLLPEDRPMFPAKSFLPLVNLVTLSVDDTEGFRGCAHRHAPDQLHFLCADGSSYGFTDRPLYAGDWRAVINVHAVVTTACTYTMKITAEGGDAQ